MSDAARKNEAPDLVSPWMPETDRERLKVLGKLAEECNELGSAIARCIIQGIDEREPVTGKWNREWLMEELADVRANVSIAIEFFQLDVDLIAARQARKKGNILRWLFGINAADK